MKRREAHEIPELSDIDRSGATSVFEQAKAHAEAELIAELKLLASLQRCPLDHLHYALIYCPACGLER